MPTRAAGLGATTVALLFGMACTSPSEPAVDSTYPAAFVWFARLIVVGLVVLFVVELVQGVRWLVRAVSRRQR
jgi:hypothetical protein